MIINSDYPKFKFPPVVIDPVLVDNLYIPPLLDDSIIIKEYIDSREYIEDYIAGVYGQKLRKELNYTYPETHHTLVPFYCECGAIVYADVCNSIYVSLDLPYYFDDDIKFWYFELENNDNYDDVFRRGEIPIEELFLSPSPYLPEGYTPLEDNTLYCPECDKELTTLVCSGAIIYTIMADAPTISCSWLIKDDY